MTLQLSSGNSISLTNIQSEFGGINPISISEYYAGAATGYVPAGTTGSIQITQNQSVMTAIPSSGAIKFSNFYGSSQKDAAGSQTFYSSGTFTGKRGYNSVTLEWYDNNGYNGQIFAQTSGTAYTVTIGAAGAISSFGTQNTVAFDKTVMNVYSAVDAVSYPRATIYNNLSSAYTFREAQSPNSNLYDTFIYNGTNYWGRMISQAAQPAGYDKNGTYYGASPVYYPLQNYFSAQPTAMTFTNDSEQGHGPLWHRVGITTFPAVVAYGGSVYLSYNSSGGNQGISIDVWNPATGDLRMAFGESNPGENFMQGLVNYRQPVWIKASWG